MASSTDCGSSRTCWTTDHSLDCQLTTISAVDTEESVWRWKGSVSNCCALSENMVDVPGVNCQPSAWSTQETLIGKVLRWKLYLQDKEFHFYHVPGKEVHQGVSDALSWLCENHMPAKQKPEEKQERTVTLSALQPKQHLSDEVYDKIAAVHNSSVGHWGHAKCKLRLNDPSVSDRMISTFIRQCPCCQVMSRLKLHIKTHPFTCASYNSR